MEKENTLDAPNASFSCKSVETDKTLSNKASIQGFNHCSHID